MEEDQKPCTRSSAVKTHKKMKQILLNSSRGTGFKQVYENYRGGVSRYSKAPS